MFRKKLLTVAVAVAVCGSLIPASAVAGPAATDTTADDWATDSGDASHTNANDGAAPTGPNATVTQQYPDVNASTDFGEPTLPAVVNGTAYVAYDNSGTSPTYVSKGHVVAYDSETGEVRWNQSDLPGLTTTPTVADGRVYVTSNGDGADADDDPGNQTGGVYALHTATGEIVWARNDSSYRESNEYVVDDGRLYVAHEGRLSALNATTGETIWNTTRRNRVTDVASRDGTLVVRRIADDNNQTHVHARDPATGEAEWNTTLTASHDVSFGAPYDAPQPSDVALEGDTAYLTLGQREVYALSLTDGSVVWNETMSEEGTETQWTSDPAVQNGSLYLTTVTEDSSSVHALDATTGDTTWEYVSDAGLRSPAVANDTVYVPGQQVTVEGRELGSPPQEGVYALNASSGDERWNYAFDTTAHSYATTVAPAEGALFASIVDRGVYSNEGTVYALESTENPTPADHRFIKEEEERTKPSVLIRTEPEDAENRDLDAGDNVTLTADASDPNGNITTIEWAVGSGSEFDRSGESITVPLDYCGTLTVTVRVTDDDGETVTESIELSTA